MDWKRVLVVTMLEMGLNCLLGVRCAIVEVSALLPGKLKWYCHHGFVGVSVGVLDQGVAGRK